jgi:cholesterol oxidase
MKRRDFMKGGLAAGAAAAFYSPAEEASAATPEEKYRKQVPELFAPVSRPPAYTPAIVIGSGFGGAISAYRLAQAGIQTTVLERGCRWPIDPWRKIHSNDFFPDGRAYWHRTRAKHLTGLTFNFDKFGGILDVTEYENIDVWRAACVGGGSKVFTGVMIQPERSYFEAIFGNTVSFDEMNQVYYPRVRAMLRLSPLPKDLYYKPSFGHSRVWDKQVRLAGYEPKPIDGIWNWNVVRKEFHFRSRQSASIGESNHGNSNGGKYDLTQNYLKFAEDSGFTTIYPGMQVRGISRDANGQYLVDIKQIDPMGETIDEYVIACSYLFMAAGSIGTTELLLKARELGELPNLNEYIGEGWGTNGDTAVVRTVSEVQGLYQASPSAGMIHDTRFGPPITMENWYALHVPINLTAIGSLGMGFDMTNRCRFQYNPATDSTTLLWPRNGNADVVAATRAMNNKIAAASLTLPGLLGVVPDVNDSFTAHPLGGAILGSAADNYGRIKGYNRLYVMDGAMVNGSTGAVNPSLTISALAERNIEHILANDF